MVFDKLFLFGLLFIFIYTLFMHMRKNSYKSIKKETLDYNDMENAFFDKIKEGSMAYKILRIYTPFDLMMIKSFFISENIPYYVEFEHRMKIEPFVQILNCNNVNLYVLDEDYSDSIIVLKNYIKNNNYDEFKIRSAFRGIFEFICIGWVVPSPHNYLGIEIIYKS
jgi:hypothetical protein